MSCFQICWWSFSCFIFILFDYFFCFVTCLKIMEITKKLFQLEWQNQHKKTQLATNQHKKQARGKQETLAGYLLYQFFFFIHVRIFLLQLLIILTIINYSQPPQRSRVVDLEPDGWEGRRGSTPECVIIGVVGLRKLQQISFFSVKK